MSVRTRELFRKATSLKRAMSRKRVYAVRTSRALPRTGSHTPLRGLAHHAASRPVSRRGRRGLSRRRSRVRASSTPPFTPYKSRSYSQPDRVVTARSPFGGALGVRGAADTAVSGGLYEAHAGKSATTQVRPTEPSAVPTPSPAHSLSARRQFESAAASSDPEIALATNSCVARPRSAQTGHR